MPVTAVGSINDGSWRQRATHDDGRLVRMVNGVLARVHVLPFSRDAYWLYWNHGLVFKA
jgi:hypothetical protein